MWEQTIDLHAVTQINTTVLFHSQGTATKSELGEVYFSNPTAIEKEAKEGEDSDNSEEKDQDSAWNKLNSAIVFILFESTIVVPQNTLANLRTYATNWLPSLFASFMLCLRHKKMLYVIVIAQVPGLGIYGSKQTESKGVAQGRGLFTKAINPWPPVL